MNSKYQREIEEKVCSLRKMGAKKNSFVLFIDDHTM
jgi:hypothetical protein